MIFRYLLIFLLLASPAWAVDYWASTTGSGTTCSEGSPCTLAYTVNTKAGAGDTIYVKAGTYTGTTALVLDSNTMTLTADDQENIPILRPSSGDWWNGFVRITGTTVTVSYLHIDTDDRSSSWGDIGIRIFGDSAYIDNVEIEKGYASIVIDAAHSTTIINCDLHGNGDVVGTTNPADGTGFGVFLYGSGGASGWSQKVLIQDTVSYDNGGDSLQTGNSGLNTYIEVTGCSFYGNGEDGIDIKRTQYMRIHGNSIYDNYGNGIVTHSSPTDGDDIEIYQNKIYGNGWAGIFGATDATNWDVWSNLIYMNARCLDGTCDDWNGSWLSGGTDWSGVKGSSTMEFYHNVLYNNGTVTDQPTPNGNDFSNLQPYGATVRNNIIFMTGGLSGNHGNIRDSNTAGLNNNYICYVSGGTCDSDSGYDGDSQSTRIGTSTSVDPGMTDETTYDFTITTTGAVVYQAGANLTIATDYAGTSFHATTPTVGAYEFSSGASPPPETVAGMVLGLKVE